MVETTSSNKDLPPAAPPLGMRVRLLDFLVNFFPRRLVPTQYYSVSDKFCMHTIMLKKQLSTENKTSQPVDFELGIAEHDVLASIMSHPESLAESVYHRRIEMGDTCCYLKVNGQLASYNWMSSSHCGIFRGFDKIINFKKLLPQQVYSYDFYTYKKQRGKGYGSILKTYFFPHLASLGKTEVFTCIEPDNKESLAVHFKYGYLPVSMVHNFRLLDWTYTIRGNRRSNRRLGKWYQHYLEQRRSLSQGASASCD